MNDDQTSSPTELCRLTRDPEVWLEDGSVVLAYQSIIFRVHKSILAAHCEVFEDIFAVYASPEHEETYEGYPLIVMHDKPIDMCRFLKAVIYRNYARDIAKLSLSELSSILRLSTKYSCPSLREKIISHLKTLFTLTLETYQSQRRKILLPPDFNGITGVNLGRQCDIPSIVPAAYYVCSRARAKNFLYDGIIYTPPDTGEPELVEFSDKHYFRDFLRFQAAMERLVHVLVHGQIISGFHFCSTCNANRAGFHRVIHALGSFTSIDFGFLSIAPRPYSSSDTSLCATCWDTTKLEYGDLQDTIWSPLPNCCGQSGWEG